jgi:ubiquinone/menaquinone biosynthesis C-methylase UbiE
MLSLSKLRKKWFPRAPLAANVAYDRWAAEYDSQPGNLVLKLDESLLDELLATISLKDKIIADIGCGTGRHWAKLLAQQPARLIGYDVSAGMLVKLKEKFPEGEVHHFEGNKLAGLEDNSCDILISTLTMAHIENPLMALSEWQRVTRPGGLLYITDFHPEILSRGGTRSFKTGNQVRVVKNYIYPLAAIRQWAGQLQLSELRCTELLIDEQVKPFYAAQQALHLYEQFKGLPLVYAFQFKKQE